MTEELVDRHPQQVQALIDTWFDILNFVSTNPTTADRIMADRVGVSYEEFQLFKTGTKIFTIEEN